MAGQRYMQVSGEDKDPQTSLDLESSSTLTFPRRSVWQRLDAFTQRFSHLILLCSLLLFALSSWRLSAANNICTQETIDRWAVAPDYCMSHLQMRRMWKHTHVHNS